jgi:hypothetical protein
VEDNVFRGTVKDKAIMLYGDGTFSSSGPGEAGGAPCVSICIAAADRCKPRVSDQGAKAMSLKLMKPLLEGSKLASSCADRAAPAAASGGVCGTGCN